MSRLHLAATRPAEPFGCLSANERMTTGEADVQRNLPFHGIATAPILSDPMADEGRFC